jgi:hypothetical protein
LQNFVCDHYKFLKQQIKLSFKWFKGWVSSEIISLCEQLAGQTAKVQRVPLILLK